jgi:hypothetical protein
MRRAHRWHFEPVAGCGGDGHRPWSGSHHPGEFYLGTGIALAPGDSASGWLTALEAAFERAESREQVLDAATGYESASRAAPWAAVYYANSDFLEAITVLGQLDAGRTWRRHVSL